MTTLRELVEEISRYLVDQEENYEFTHWEEEDILTYYRDARRIVAINRKGEFTRPKTMTLKPGVLQTLPDGCSEFVSVIGTVDKYGNITETVDRTSLRSTRSISRPVCEKPGGYKLASYQFDVSNLRNFYVQPPVPAGTKVQVMVNCFGLDPILSLDEDVDIPEHLIAVIKEFMLYYAYGRDTESVPARQYSEQHWKSGVALLGAERQTPAVALTVATTPETRPV